jgi:hypothetical protein
MAVRWWRTWGWDFHGGEKNDSRGKENGNSWNS